jgi:hypothetical protein
MKTLRRSRVAGDLRCKLAQLLRGISRLQQRKPFLAVLFGTYKKFSDDQADQAGLQRPELEIEVRRRRAVDQD